MSACAPRKCRPCAYGGTEMSRLRLFTTCGFVGISGNLLTERGHFCPPVRLASVGHARPAGQECPGSVLFTTCGFVGISGNPIDGARTFLSACAPGKCRPCASGGTGMSRLRFKPALTNKGKRFLLDRRHGIFQSTQSSQGSRI